MKKIALKICGMKYNTSEVVELAPDYLGFIFYANSPRNFEGSTPTVPQHIEKVGVFVDAELDFISEKLINENLNVVQLHGDESTSYCDKLRERYPKIEIWKVFSIKDQFDFNVLKPYEELVDKFLFDTKGKEKGGNGYTFDWTVLKDYSSQKPIVLSGGIGLEELEKVKTVLSTNLPIVVIDVNSKFEKQPGLKIVSDLKKFKDEL